MKTHVIRIDSLSGTWRKYLIVRDNSVIVIEATAAMFDGYHVQSVTEQGNDDWCGMDADAILAFKRSTGHPVNLLPSDAVAGVLDVASRFAPGFRRPRS